MPIDPYFTSKIVDEDDYKKRKRTAYAKAVQLRILCSRGSRAKRSKAVRRSGKYSDPAAKCRETLKQMRAHGKPIFVTGQPSLSGFRPPRRVWETVEQRQRRIDKLKAAK